MDDGFRVSASGGVLPELSDRRRWQDGMHLDIRQNWRRDCPVDETSRAHRLGPPACAYDLDGLREYFQRIKEEYPDERALIVGAQSRTPWQVVAATLDSARESFPDVLLFSGDG